jgi:hypothetical protein
LLSFQSVVISLILLTPLTCYHSNLRLVKRCFIFTHYYSHNVYSEKQI